MQTKRELVFEFKLEAYLIAVLVAWVLPLLSMIVPVINSLGVELRDALDLFRDKHSQLTVQFTRLESMYGLNVFQTAIGLTFSLLSTTVYVIIPFSVI